jgi:hypothetical protein
VKTPEPPLLLGALPLLLELLAIETSETSETSETKAAPGAHIRQPIEILIEYYS